MAKTKIKFRNNLNSRYFEKNYEQNDGKSVTVPSQSMTPRELLIRFASGIPVEAGKVPIYDMDNEIPDWDTMDQIERHAYMQDLKQKRDAVTERIKKANAKAQEMKMNTIIEQRVADRKAELERKEFEKWKQSQSQQPPINE